MKKRLLDEVKNRVPYELAFLFSINKLNAFTNCKQME